MIKRIILDEEKIKDDGSDEQSKRRKQKTVSAWGDTEVGLKGDVPASGHSALPGFQDSTRKYPAREANTTSK